MSHCIITVSIVTYGKDIAYLPDVLGSLAIATAELQTASQAVVRVFLVDNGPESEQRSAQLRAALSSWDSEVELISGQGNVGYGRGHNLAIARAESSFHLILNPDIDLSPSLLRKGIAFFQQHPDCGLVTAAVSDQQGELQYLCKRYPTVFDLLLRGFAPKMLRKLFQQRLDHYEMRDLINRQDVVWNPPLISGCFMFFRSPLLKRLVGFDPAYFLYFEDFDLSLRAGCQTQIAYVPELQVLHHGGGAAKKGVAHIRMFAISAIRFFSLHGWRLF